MKRILVVAATLIVALFAIFRAGVEAQQATPSETPAGDQGAPPAGHEAAQATPPGSRGAAAPAPVNPAGPGGLGTKVFSLRYRRVDDTYLLISPYVGPRGSIRTQPAQRTLTIVDAPENLQRISGLIGAYDVPPRSVQVSVQLILASSGEGAAAPAPPPIRGVIDKLNALSTRWNDYQMVGDARVLGTEGERSSLRVGNDYKVDFRIDQVSDESRVIRFKPFELQRREVSVEGLESYAPIMNTVLNLRDSQLFIVGASKIERSNRALFMTVTASLQRP